MRDYFWFKLIVRAIGILVLALGLPTAFTWFAQVASYFWYDRAPALDDLPMVLLVAAGYSSQVMFGLYLLFGGRWIIQRCLRDAKGRCPNCEYDVTGVDSGLCPECGLAIGARGNAPAASVPATKP